MAKKRYPNRKTVSMNIDHNMWLKAKALAGMQGISLSTFIGQLIEQVPVQDYSVKMKDLKLDE